MKKVLLAGASGMIGSLILTHALDAPEITKVSSLVRKRTNHQHPKLQEILISNFADYSTHTHVFQEVDAAFFCIGVYTGQVSDKLFKEITVDYAIAFANSLKSHSPEANFCFLSGAGADRSEKSRTSFARYKGMAENQISALGLKFYSFRPGYIYPVKPRKEPNFMYRISRTFYPLIKLMGSNSSITSTELAKAMFYIGLKGAKREILENKDILEYSGLNQS